VTFAPIISGSTARKYGLNLEEESKFKKTLEALGSQIIRSSSSATRIQSSGQIFNPPDSRQCAKKVLYNLF